MTDITSYIDEKENKKEEPKQVTQQQWQIDHKLIEQLPKTIQCLRCREGTMERCITKRGIHYKCHNCGYDTNQVYDWTNRDDYIKRCMETLKKMFPKLNFVLNYTYSPNSILTGELAERSRQYDIGVFWFGQKIARLRVEVNQNIDHKRFMETEECYVVGRPEVIHYMAKKDGIIVHFLVDDPEKRIAMSRMKIIKQYCPMKKDRFGNEQYIIPKDMRPIIVTFDIKEMEDLLFKGFHRILYEDATIL